jgi:hypothetical protein
MWSRHPPGYVGSRASLGADQDRGGEVFDIERDGKEEAVSAGALIVDTPTGYDEMSHDDQRVVWALGFLNFPGFTIYEVLWRPSSAARRSVLMGKRAAAWHAIEWLRRGTPRQDRARPLQQRGARPGLQAPVHKRRLAPQLLLLAELCAAAIGARY